MSDNTLSSNVSLCDALDRILSQGVAVNGDIAISVAGVDLLYIGLRGLLCAVDALGEVPASLRGESTRPYVEDFMKSQNPAEPIFNDSAANEAVIAAITGRVQTAERTERTL